MELLLFANRTFSCSSACCAVVSSLNPFSQGWRQGHDDDGDDDGDDEDENEGDDTGE